MTTCPQLLSIPNPKEGQDVKSFHIHPTCECQNLWDILNPRWDLRSLDIEMTECSNTHFSCQQNCRPDSRANGSSDQIFRNSGLRMRLILGLPSQSSARAHKIIGKNSPLAISTFLDEYPPEVFVAAGLAELVELGELVAVVDATFVTEVSFMDEVD